MLAFGSIKHPPHRIGGAFEGHPIRSGRLWALAPQGPPVSIDPQARSILSPGLRKATTRSRLDPSINQRLIDPYLRVHTYTCRSWISRRRRGPDGEGGGSSSSSWTSGRAPQSQTMESIVRAALAAGGPGRFLSFQKMPSDGGAADPAALGEIDPPEPPPSPSPAVRFASPVAIPLAAKDELRHAPSPLAAVTGAGLEDVEAPVWPPPPTGGSDGLQPDYMAMTVSSIVGSASGRRRARTQIWWPWR